MSKQVINEVVEQYPRCAQYGLTVHMIPVPHIKHADINRVMKARRISKVFSKLFGCQTAAIEGLYPWDVEAVLERIESGMLTGSQLLWD